MGTTVKQLSRSRTDYIANKAQEVAIERVLVDRFKNGDQAAFDEMVLRYWDRIFAMVRQLLGISQDAEEVTQDAFVRAHRGLANFRGDSAFSTRSEEHTSELQSRGHLVCRLLLEKNNKLT